MRRYLQVMILFLFTSKGFADPLSFDFDRDPTDEDFETIAREYSNPLRPTFVRPPANPGAKNGASLSYSTTAISKKALDRAKSYFGDDVPTRASVVGFTVENYQAADSLKNSSASFLVSYNRLMGSKLSVYSLGLRLGNEFLGARAGYTTELGLQHVAICGYNVEGVMGLPLGPLGTAYAGYGLSAMGVAAYTQAMSRQYETTWLDRYATVGFNLQPGRFHNDKDGRAVSLAAEGQYSSTPKQFTILTKVAVDF